MSLNEKSVTVTANTSADEVDLPGDEGEISVGGTFDTATVSYHSWSAAFGRGPSIRTAAQAAHVL